MILEVIVPVAPNSAANVSTRAAAPSLRATVFKHALLFCAAVLFVGLLSLTHGLDMSPGFF